MPDPLLAATSTSEPWEMVELVADLITLLFLVVLLVMDMKYIRASRRLAKALDLPQGQWLRPAKTLAFDPVIELIAVGVLLGADLVQNWEHMVVGVVGALLGLWWVTTATASSTCGHSLSTRPSSSYAARRSTSR